MIGGAPPPGRRGRAWYVLLFLLVASAVRLHPAAAFVPPRGLTAVPLTTRPEQLRKASGRVIKLLSELVSSDETA
jgi:hypothetical protein